MTRSEPRKGAQNALIGLFAADECAQNKRTPMAVTQSKAARAIPRILALPEGVVLETQVPFSASGAGTSRS